MNSIMVAALAAFYSKRRVILWAKAHNHLLTDIIGESEIADFVRYNDCIAMNKNDRKNSHLRIIGR